MKESQFINNIKKILGVTPKPKFSDDERRDFINRLFKVTDEKESIVLYAPFRVSFAIAGALATVLIFFFVYHSLLSPLHPVLDGVKGTVKVYRARKNEWILAERKPLRLNKNDLVKTFKDGQADIIVANLYQLRLKKDSEISPSEIPLKATSGNIQYKLAKGKVFTYYKEKRIKKREFIIQTPQADITVVGTDFMVNIMPDTAKTWVGVLDGTVRVTGRHIVDMSKIKDATVFVEPGKKTIVCAGNPPTRPERLIEDELLDLEELYRIGTKPQVALLISTGKTRVRELLTFTLLYISSEKPGILPEKIIEIERNYREIVKNREKQRYLENIKQFEDIVNEYPNPKYDVQFILFIAAYYEYAGEHAKAIEVFQRVIDDYPESNLASIAQCAIGVIYEEKLADREEAKRAYQKVISNYPDSPEAEEAALGLDRLSR